MTDGGPGAAVGLHPPTPGAEARERVLAGLPVSQRQLDAAGVSTAFLEGGAGSPLVLLHGGIECGGALLGARDPAPGRESPRRRARRARAW